MYNNGIDNAPRRQGPEDRGAFGPLDHGHRNLFLAVRQQTADILGAEHQMATSHLDYAAEGLWPSSAMLGLRPSLLWDCSG